MATDIREYNPYTEGEPMTVTAFVGNEGDRSIQFTIGYSFCTLSEAALLDLLHVICDRIDGVKGYTATGEERDDITYKPEV